MFKKMAIVALPALMFATTTDAVASSYTYLIDHGTPGVIASNSKMARLVLIGSGDCSSVPYDIIADGVKSLSGKLNLSKPVSFPLDFTTVTLSCSEAGIKAVVSKEDSGLFQGN